MHNDCYTPNNMIRFELYKGCKIGIWRALVGKPFVQENTADKLLTHYVESNDYFVVKVESKRLNDILLSKIEPSYRGITGVLLSIKYDIDRAFLKKNEDFYLIKNLAKWIKSGNY